MIEVEEDLYIVFLEHEAFKNIVIHTAQFAHFDLKVRSWKEVYGFLVGYIDEDTNWTHITDAIPITHGTHYGVEFKKKHYVLSSYLNLMCAERDEFFVGWYHSHPGLGLFLSQTDIINHLGYQIVNPKAIALVFDHTKIISQEQPVELFQLADASFGASSAYNEIEYFIGGFNKKDEIDLIKKFYYEIETDVIEKKIPPIEKDVKEKVKTWRKKTKIKLPTEKKYKKERGKLKETVLPYFK